MLLLHSLQSPYQHTTCYPAACLLILIIVSLSVCVDGNDVVIQEASMWTQKDIVAFKNAIQKESRMENHTDCIIKVGSGETVTVRAYLTC